MSKHRTKPHNGYRPTVKDMTDSIKWQKLSCRESGKFDHTVNPKPVKKEPAQHA